MSVLSSLVRLLRARSVSGPGVGGLVIGALLWVGLSAIPGWAQPAVSFAVL